MLVGIWTTIALFSVTIYFSCKFLLFTSCFFATCCYWMRCITLPAKVYHPIPPPSHRGIYFPPRSKYPHPFGHLPFTVPAVRTGINRSLHVGQCVRPFDRTIHLLSLLYYELPGHLHGVDITPEEILTGARCDKCNRILARSRTNCADPDFRPRALISICCKVMGNTVITI